jgi:hypothetical protein
MNSRLALLAAAGLSLSACTYDYTNPAEKLDAGQVTGRVVADTAGTGAVAPIGGVTVALKGSANIQENRPTGTFFLFGLPEGRHTLLFTKAIPGAGSTWALQRDVEVGFGADGQLEGVLLGDVRLRYSVALSGTFSIPVSPINCGDFADAPTGYAIDEVTGQVAVVVPLTERRNCYDYGLGTWVDRDEYTGAFGWSLPIAPVGPHRMRFAVTANAGTYSGQTWVGGPLVQNVPESSEGQVLALAAAVLRDPSATPGRLRFRVVTQADLSALTIALDNFATGGHVVVIPDSTGWVDEPLDEGVWEVSIDASFDPALIAPLPRDAVVVADQVTEFGELAVLDLFSVERGTLACTSQAQCYATEACVAGACVDQSPVADTPYCITGELVSSQCTDTCAPEACGFDGTGACSDWGGSVISCIPAGSVSGNCKFRETGEILYPRSGC